MRDLLSGLIAQAAPSWQILTTAENVADQPFSTEQTSLGWREIVLGHAVLLLASGTVQTRLDEWPASANPVAVAAVD